MLKYEPLGLFTKITGFIRIQNGRLLFHIDQKLNAAFQKKTDTVSLGVFFFTKSFLFWQNLIVASSKWTKVEQKRN